MKTCYLNFPIFFIIEMEKQIKQSIPVNSQVKIHACFQQLETLRFLTFLEHRQGKLLYRGLTEQQNRKSKQFCFNTITLLTDKLKHAHNQAIRDIVEALLRGQSRSALIFGNDESKKEKLMIGQSQNAGLLLLILSELFNTCYDRELQDKVTIKLSCWQQSQNQISDGLGTNQSVIIDDDTFQGKVIIGSPEIIVRNMKSALKVIKLFMRKSEQTRQQKEDSTQTLIISIKLQIDNNYDKQGNVTEYLLSKLHIVKFANPYSLKATGKHPQWFISLFNHFQADAIQKMRTEQQIVEDEAISYIKECVIKGVNGIHCFSCFGNKMTANQCLTTLKFSSYLQYAKLTPHSMVINLPEVKKQHLVLQSQLIKNQEQKQSWIQGKEFNWLQLQQALLIQSFQEIIDLNIKGMELGNILEYEYAIAFTTACDKLEKYIFNQEVQDYFYAKKVSLEVTSQLKQTITAFMQAKRRSFELQKKIIQKVTAISNRLKRQTADSRAVKYLLNSKAKQKQIYQKLFSIYNAEVCHFLYQENEEFTQKVANHQKTLIQPTTAEPIQPSNVQLSSFSIQLLQKSRETQLVQNTCKAEAKRKKAVDQLQMMFTNTNASLCGRRLKN